MMHIVTPTDASDYNARHLSVLEGLEAVRKRPGMYIGSTDHRGLMHCLWEIIDNAVDEALEGHCDTIDVRLHPDHSASVADNGRGIPVDIVLVVQSLIVLFIAAPPLLRAVFFLPKTDAEKAAAARAKAAKKAVAA